MNIFRRAWQRFNETMPAQAKRFIFAMYATLVFAQTVSILPTYVVEKVAIGLIVLHFVMEFCFPNKDNQPPKAMIWLLLAGSLLLTGCRDQMIKARFGKQSKDSVTVSVTEPVRFTVIDTVSIPRDSVVTSYKTDTTTFHRIIETNRTRLVIDHQRNGETRIQADSKPVTITKTINTTRQVTLQAKCPPVVKFDLGVSKWYKWGCYGLGALMVAMVVGLIRLLLRVYNVTMPTITRKSDNGIGFKH